MNKRFIPSAVAIASGLLISTSYNACGKFQVIEDHSNSNFAQAASEQENETPQNQQPAPTPLPSVGQTPPINPSPNPVPSPTSGGQPIPGTINSSKPWTNEPSGSLVLLDCGFDDATCGGKLDDTYKSNGKTLNVVQDSTAPLSKSNVMRSSLFYPNKSGGTQLGFYPSQAAKQIYVGMFWRTNLEFSGNLVEMNKMFFMRGPSSNGFFGQLNYGVPGFFKIGFSHNSGTLNNSHTCAADLGLTCYPNVGSGIVATGQWHLLEFYMKGSTTLTSRDGILRWWVDGVLTGNYTNFNYGPSFNELIWSETWDGFGNGTGFKADAHHFIDHIHISIPQ